jgi:hypothetical protein
VAYLSPRYGPDDPRRRANNPANAGGGGAAPVAPVGAPAAGSPTGTGDPGALRSFFEANKGAGQAVFGGLADSISQRISDAESQFRQLPLETTTTTPGTAPSASFTHGAFHAPTVTPGTPAVTTTTPSTEHLDARQAIIKPISDDLARLGQGAEGYQALLTQGAGPGYTPGMGRLDSWLAAGAADPARVQELQSRLSGLGAEQPAAQPKPSTDTLDPWLRGGPLGWQPAAPAQGGDNAPAPQQGQQKRKTVRGYLYGV